MKGKLHIGTSGYAYASWRGDFYPRELKQADWLNYYAGQFDCVEINNTFYRQPQLKNVARWVTQVPKEFEFCFKIFRGLSHYKKLNDGEAEWRDFLESLAPAVKHRGPLLLQLPPSLKMDAGRLDVFLSWTGKDGWPMAVEFRHSSWYVPEVMKVLDKHQAAVVLHDKPGSKWREANDSPFVYVRYHGPKGDYGGSYGSAALERWGSEMGAWLKQGRRVYAFFNNDRDGFAVKNAATLRQMIEG